MYVFLHAGLVRAKLGQGHPTQAMLCKMCVVLPETGRGVPITMGTIVEGGVVVAVNAPAAPPEPPPPPREETREERNARLDALLAASREREERAQAARVETQRVKIGRAHV